MMQNYKEHISINPNIRFGKPCIINTRITISDILDWLSSGMTYEEISKNFPEIKKVHILAALSFAAHREQAVKTIFYDKTAI